FNLAVGTVVEFLGKKCHQVESNPNAKIDGALYDLLLDEFGTDKEIKAKSQQVVQQRQERETITLAATGAKAETKKAKEEPEVLIHNAQPTADLGVPAAEAPSEPAPAAEEPEVLKAKVEKAAGPKTLGKSDLEAAKKPKKTAKKEEPATPPAAAEAPAEAPEKAAPA